MNTTTNNHDDAAVPPRAVRTIIEEANAANASRGKDKSDKSYQREWKKFIEFVTTKRSENVLPPSPLYLTRDSVDLYFATVVANLTVHPKTARRIRPALQFFADHEEHSRNERFVVDSGSVQKALKAQVTSYNEEIERSFTDPHKKIKIMMISADEQKAFFDHIYLNNVQNWASLATSWNMGCNAYIRMHSFLQFPLCHLRVDTNHGPVKQGPNARVLCYILSPQIRKEGNKVYSRTRVSGCYRHKTYYQCATGAIAMALFCRLQHDTDLCFNQKETNGRPKWFNRLLLNDWANSRNASTAYKRILDTVGISWGRVLHLRVHGIEYGSTEGLGDEDVASISKHNEDGKLGKVYMTELRPHAMKVMAGCGKDEPYFVSRTLLELPWTDEECCHFIFPQVDTWREQAASVNGDNSEAARNFLFEVLPFLARVAVEDGIYFLRDYPNHEVSLRLKNVMPAIYERWAKTARDEVTEIERRHAGSKSLENHSVQTQIAFCNIEQHMINIENRQNRMFETQQQLLASQGMMFNLLNSWRGADVPRQLERGGSGAGSLHPAGRQQQSIIGAATLPSAGVQNLQNPQQQHLHHINNHPNTILKPFTSVLRNSPRVPVFSNSLPDTIERLLYEHEVVYKLTEYQNVRMSGWPQRVKQAFGRRKFVYNTVITRANNLRLGTFDQRKERAARSMDAERESLGGLSVYKYILYLKGQK
jgi:hypothetical protein